MIIRYHLAVNVLKRIFNDDKHNIHIIYVKKHVERYH